MKLCLLAQMEDDTNQHTYFFTNLFTGGSRLSGSSTEWSVYSTIGLLSDTAFIISTQTSNTPQALLMSSPLKNVLYPDDSAYSSGDNARATALQLLPQVLTPRQQIVPKKPAKTRAKRAPKKKEVATRPAAAPTVRPVDAAVMAWDSGDPDWEVYSHWRLFGKGHQVWSRGGIVLATCIFGVVAAVISKTLPDIVFQVYFSYRINQFCHFYPGSTAADFLVPAQSTSTVAARDKDSQDHSTLLHQGSSMTTGSVWNPDNIKDVAESVGLANLSTDVVDHLTRDVEFRIAQVLEEALKFMRHSKRTTLFTQDISQALRVLDVEPLYGYETTRPLRFGEASIGSGQPLFYLEDEEIDFEKLINAPLPKVPREITFTAHWLAVEGVQPTIPQNPTPADSSRNGDLLPKGPGANPNLAAISGADNVTVKPLVKHILSKELQLYFEHVCAAVLDEQNEEYRVAAFGSLRADPGLHQLVPYFVQFIAEKVTHNLKNIFVLTQMLHLISALLQNPNLHIASYVASLVPPVITCLVGKRLGSSSTVDTGHLPLHYQLRDLAASLLRQLTRKDLAAATPTLKPRLARTLLKHLLSTSQQPLGTYYGAILGLNGIAGAEGVHVLILPNLAVVGDVLKDAQNEGGTEEQTRARKREVDAVVDAIVKGLETLEEDGVIGVTKQGNDMDVEISEDEKRKLLEKVGGVIADRLVAFGRRTLVLAVITGDIKL